MRQCIKIHYDFIDGSELSYGEAVECEENFTTSCLEFFCTDNINAVVVKRDGSSISVKDLLDNTGDHTVKHIRKAHNLHRMLVAGAFSWKENCKENREELR